MNVSLQLYFYLERQLFMNIRVIIAVALSSENTKIHRKRCSIISILNPIVGHNQ